MKAKPVLIVMLLTGLIFSPDGRPQDVSAADRPRPLVYQIPIKDQIEPALLYVIRRGVREAARDKADAIVFVMNTPGGRVQEAREIVSLIGQIDVPVYTFVEKDAYSAGAIIALATPHIYMAPASVIGAATPMLMTPFGGMEQMPEAVEEKMTSAVAALARAAAEQGGHDPHLAEAMVRRELGYKSGTNVISREGELLTLTASEAEGILSEGTVADVSAMLKKAGLPNAEIRSLAVTPAERVARFIAALAPLLLMLGLGGIYLEFKTPGFGLPGITGITALALFFFGHHIAGLAGMEDIVLFIAGFVLLFIEVFVTPGFGVVGISGISLILLSLISAMSWQLPGQFWPSFSDRTLQRAFINLALGMGGTVLLGIAAGKYLPKSRALRPLVLGQQTDRTSGFTAAREHGELLGKDGTAEMNLHPAGRALFGADRVNVISRGEFIEQGSRIRVVEVHGSRIIVEKI